MTNERKLKHWLGCSPMGEDLISSTYTIFILLFYPLIIIREIPLCMLPDPIYTKINDILPHTLHHLSYLSKNYLKL